MWHIIAIDTQLDAHGQAVELAEIVYWGNHGMFAYSLIWSTTCTLTPRSRVWVFKVAVCTFSYHKLDEEDERMCMGNDRNLTLLRRRKVTAESVCSFPSCARSPITSSTQLPLPATQLHGLSAQY